MKIPPSTHPPSLAPTPPHAKSTPDGGACIATHRESVKDDARYIYPASHACALLCAPDQGKLRVPSKPVIPTTRPLTSQFHIILPVQVGVGEGGHTNKCLLWWIRPSIMAGSVRIFFIASMTPTSFKPFVLYVKCPLIV